MWLLRVLLDLTRMTVADLLSRANAVYAGMNLNPAYPNPPIPMPVFRTAIDDFSAAVVAALDGGAKAIAHRNALGEALRKMLRLLAHYVEINCNDDLETLLSSGFPAATGARSRANPVSEHIRRIGPGALSGEVLVGLVAVPGAVSYELQWAPLSANGTPGEWTKLPIARVRPATTVAGLTPGTTYAFQVRAVTRSGWTDWSDSVIRTCV